MGNQDNETSPLRLSTLTNNTKNTENPDRLGLRPINESVDRLGLKPVMKKLGTEKIVFTETNGNNTNKNGNNSNKE